VCVEHSFIARFEARCENPHLLLNALGIPWMTSLKSNWGFIHTFFLRYCDQTNEQNENPKQKLLFIYISLLLFFDLVNDHAARLIIRERLGVIAIARMHPTRVGAIPPRGTRLLRWRWSATRRPNHGRQFWQQTEVCDLDFALPVTP